MGNNELQHHGILGMKWGQRRYQNKDGSLKPAGKKRYASGDSEKDSFFRARAKAKAAKAEAEAKAKAQAEKEDYEAQKQKALKSGSAQDVLKFKGELTQQEMQSAITRIRWEQDMKSLSDKELAVGKSKADKFFDGMDKAVNYTTTAAKAYNTFANIYNAFSNTDGKLLPTIQTNNTNGNRDARKKEAKEQKEKAKKERKEAEAQEAKEKAKRDKEKADKKAEKEAKKAEKAEKVKVEKEEPKKEKWWKDSNATVIDVDWTDLGTSDADISRGEVYVNRLLLEE